MKNFPESWGKVKFCGEWLVGKDGKFSTWEWFSLKKKWAKKMKRGCSASVQSLKI